MDIFIIHHFNIFSVLNDSIIYHLYTHTQFVIYTVLACLHHLLASSQVTCIIANTHNTPLRYKGLPSLLHSSTISDPPPPLIIIILSKITILLTPILGPYHPLTATINTFMSIVHTALVDHDHTVCSVNLINSLIAIINTFLLVDHPSTKCCTRDYSGCLLSRYYLIGCSGLID